MRGWRGGGLQRERTEVGGCQGFQIQWAWGQSKGLGRGICFVKKNAHNKNIEKNIETIRNAKDLQLGNTLQESDFGWDGSRKLIRVQIPREHSEVNLGKKRPRKRRNKQLTLCPIEPSSQFRWGAGLRGYCSINLCILTNLSRGAPGQEKRKEGLGLHIVQGHKVSQFCGNGPCQ